MDRISAAYIAAAEKKPNDSDVLVGLFGVYMRQMDYVRAQQVAMKMSKLNVHDASYGWWVVTCVVLQARSALLATEQQEQQQQGSLSAAKLLQLAEIMSTRLFTTKSTANTHEALLLHLDILQGAGKHGEALAALETAPEALLPMPLDRVQLKGAIACRAGDLATAAAAYREAVMADGDDWRSWQYYLDCVLPSTADAHVSPVVNGCCASGEARFPVGIVGGLADIWDRQHRKGKGDGRGGVEEGLKMAEDTLEEILLMASNNDTKRGVSIAQVDLAVRKYKLQVLDADGLIDVLADAFSAKSYLFSCIADMKQGLIALVTSSSSIVAREKLVSKCKAVINDQNAEEKVPGKKFQREVNLHLLENELGYPVFTTIEEAEGHVKMMVKIYQDHMHLSSELNEKESGYGEELLIIAIQSLFAAASLDTKNSATKYLLHGLLILEHAQKHRIASARLRLASASLSTLLLDPTSTAAHLHSLDIKNIMHDSMTGHWLLPISLATADDEASLRTALAGLGKLHEEQPLEAADQLVAAFRYGTFSKVVEIVDFFEVLDRSGAKAAARVEAQLMSIRQLVFTHTCGNNNKGSSGGIESAVGHAASLAAKKLALPPLPLLLSPSDDDDNSLTFNDDLSTRPVWFPPPSSGGRLGIASLLRDNNSNENNDGMSWWRRGGGSSVSHARTEWKQGQMRSLQRRWLIPALLVYVTNSSNDDDNGSSMALPFNAEQLLSTSKDKDTQYPWERMVDEFLVAMASSSLEGMEEALSQLCKTAGRNGALAAEAGEMALWTAVCLKSKSSSSSDIEGVRGIANKVVDAVQSMMKHINDDDSDNNCGEVVISSQLVEEVIESSYWEGDDNNQGSSSSSSMGKKALMTVVRGRRESFERIRAMCQVACNILQPLLLLSATNVD